MNARSQEFEFTAEICQVEEVVLSVFHTLLFHRSTGKFHYKKEDSYKIGTIGYEDVDCRYVDCTYVRCSSDELDKCLRHHAAQFKEALKCMERHKNGSISIEFYQKRKNPWPFPTESVPWELWTVRMNILGLNSEADRMTVREKLTESLVEKMRSICEIVNRPEYIPKMPNEADLGNVFDDRYKDVQPYLHKISFQIGDTNADVTVGNTMRKLLKDTFNY